MKKFAVAVMMMMIGFLFVGCSSPNNYDDDEAVESINYDDPNYWAQFWTEVTKTDPITGITEYWKYYKEDVWLYRKIYKSGHIVKEVNYYENSPEYFKEKYPELNKMMNYLEVED